MTKHDHDLRLIEDYLPIQAISAEASREKNVRKGHISTLHLWWARRPLVACRAAVYGALVSANRWVKDVDLKNPPADPAKVEAMKNGAMKGLNRAAAGRFVTELCKYPGSPRIIAQAQEHILDAHAERLTEELMEAKKSDQSPPWVDEFNWPKDQTRVTRNDIELGHAPRPRVLDMFAGGGAIPLEALRLGCEAYALDLNPVAHIIQLCTLVYPQKYGKPDPTARGMTGPKGKDGNPTWGGLADEVRHWGNWVLEKVKTEIGDLYPLIPDPAYKEKRKTRDDPTLFKTPIRKDDVPPGYLIPVAYLWTRTVKCKNPACGAIVPLVKQTWLCKKKGRYVALRMVVPRGKTRVRFEVVEHENENDFDFDPAGFSSAGNATCPFCSTVADSDHVKAEGLAGRLGEQLMAIACTKPKSKGKVYLAGETLSPGFSSSEKIETRLNQLCKSAGLSIPTELIVTDAKNANFCRLYGLVQFKDLFTTRQLFCLLSFTAAIREAKSVMLRDGLNEKKMKAVTTYLAAILDRLADFNSALCIFNYTGGRGVVHTFGRQALPMVWDFAESNPFNPAGASWVSGIEDLPAGLRDATDGDSAIVRRGSATALPWPDCDLDAVITDPPYYDNVPYADISDYFYVWLRRTIGDLYPEHFANPGTPKKQEAVADAVRHGGNKAQAVKAYEGMMSEAFSEAARTLREGGHLIVVYAHKTTLGWSTLVDAMRRTGFVVTEAWPLDTEKKGRLRAQNSAALASSIFLVARKRSTISMIGNYEDDVQPDLKHITQERVATLWEQGITGADLVIAAVGAGLRAFTKYERVEYANGEEVPSDKFLAEVEGVVLDVMLDQIAGNYACGVTGIDPRSRFYVLWRYVYKAAAIDAGEAIVFTYGAHVELDGQKGLSSGDNPIVEKKKNTYRVRDYSERGKDEKLGLPNNSGEPAPLIDALHRVLWLMEYSPRKLTDFFREARVNRDQLRVLAQALSGPALKGGDIGQVSAGEELAALTKLTANWKSVVDDALMPLEHSS